MASPIACPARANTCRAEVLPAWATSIAASMDNEASPVAARTAARMGAVPAMASAHPRPELGAVNAWQSVGAEVLWRRGEEPVLDAALRRLAISEHALAVELAVTDPRPCWVGVHVSERRGSLHHLDPQAVTAVLRTVTGSA